MGRKVRLAGDPNGTDESQMGHLVQKPEELVHPQPNLIEYG